MVLEVVLCVVLWCLDDENEKGGVDVWRGRGREREGGREKEEQNPAGWTCTYTRGKGASGEVKRRCISGRGS